MKTLIESQYTITAFYHFEKQLINKPGRSERLIFILFHTMQNQRDNFDLSDL